MDVFVGAKNIVGALGVLQDTMTYLRPIDVLDIFIVVLFVYAILLLLKRTHSFFIFGGMLILFGVYLVARMLNLYLTSLIFQAFFAFFAVIFVVIFQRELRNFFEWLSFRWRFSLSKKETISERLSSHIIRAARFMAEHKIGALIVLTGDDPIDRFLEGGTALDGRISTPLLLSIFDPSSPGHDGAVVIEGGRVKKFGVHLPLAERFHHFEKMGTRHRAAMGLAERSDALVVVISEERGIISLAHRGALIELDSITKLQDAVSQFFKEEVFHAEASIWRAFLTGNWREKVLAVALAFALWFIFIVQFGMGTITRQYPVSVEFRSLPEDYAVSQLAAKEITVTLSGHIQDFRLLDERSLKIVLPIAEASEGAKKVKITEDMISAPSALSVIGFTPSIIQFNLKKKAPTDTGSN